MTDNQIKRRQDLGECHQEVEQAAPQRLPMSRFVAKDVKTPHNGYRVLTNHWWAVTDEGALFFVTTRGFGKPAWHSPQCNTSRGIVERLCPHGARAEFIPLAFLSQMDDE